MVDLQVHFHLKQLFEHIILETSRDTTLRTLKLLPFF